MKTITTRCIMGLLRLTRSCTQNAENWARSVLKIEVDPIGEDSLSIGRQWRDKLNNRDWGNIPAEIREDRGR